MYEKRAQEIISLAQAAKKYAQAHPTSQRDKEYTKKYRMPLMQKVQSLAVDIAARGGSAQEEFEQLGIAKALRKL